MQALSQLSYGPTLMLRAAYYTCLFTFVEDQTKLLEAVTKRPGEPGLMSLMSGVPTGIRTPVATVKG